MPPVAPVNRDFSQLPPVGDTPLSEPRRKYTLPTFYKELPSQHCSPVGLARDEWQLLDSRAQGNLTPENRALFEDSVCLDTTRNDVHDLNLSQLEKLNQPCARVNARHEGGPDTAKAPADEAGGLEAHVYLAKGAKVMITHNIWQEQGLVNATTGVVEDVIWATGASRSELPLAVLVSCKSYNGPTRWHTEPRVGFPNGIPIIPIIPLKTTFELNGRTVYRTQLPLRLAWAVTIHKSQGLTLSRIKLGLGKREFSTGLTFVALSRVKALDGIMIVDQVDFSRVQRLGGKYLQYRLDDYAHRYFNLNNQ